MPVKSTVQPYVCAAAFLQVALLGGCDRTDGAKSTDASRTAPVATSPIAVQGPERLILAFGDSLYAGYGLKNVESMPAQIEQRLRQQGLNAKIINAGVSGDTTLAGRNRLVFALDNLPRKPDLVLLGLGGNDVLRQIPVAETRANMTAMLDELKRRQIPVVLTGMRAPPNLGPDYSTPFDAIFTDLARQYGAALDPFVLAGVIGDRRLMLPDGVHPNAKGIDIMATRIVPIVAQKLQ